MTKHDIDYGGGLTKLADPKPDEWLADKKAIMTVTKGSRYDTFGPGYGNFWADRPCELFPHKWVVLGTTDQQTGYPREVRRCQRCGSQVHQWIATLPPARGEL